MKSALVSALALLVGQACAHMAMTYPPPLRSKLNPFNGGDIDYSITSPLSASGSDFPCKGTLNLLGGPEAKPVATWQAGQTYKLSIDGGANHNGGSCQAALSFDSGKTFTVIHSYIGNCPVAGASSLQFTLPADTPSSQDALFAWTWFNNVGNREFYMNCAVVTVTGGGGQSSSASSFASRPQIFKANINNGCTTVEGSDVMFPDPGPDVTSQSSKTAPPVGNCGVAVSNPGTGGGGSGGGNSSPSPIAPAPSPSQVAPQPSAVVPVPSDIQETPKPSDPPTPSRGGGGSVPSSLPGGIFKPVPEPSSTSLEPVPETTLLTISKSVAPSAAPTSAPAATNIGSLPQPTPTPPGGDNAEGAMTPGLACQPEGQWNCVSGTHFQRCASGQWSVLMSMAPGTSCQSGASEVFVWHKKRHLGRRFRSRHA